MALTNWPKPMRRMRTVVGWELSAVMARICNGLGIYRCPNREDGGGFYLMLKSINWAS
ncbi:hypothetical protein [Mesorhizobium sp. M7A.F.Ca.ET.027.02.1.1]|uniref:hypothetical protein n=1 Tax=Mesorhizobium sp. M7A.F.Ca.ET.027.02.1.1 TaxID=2496655 RepID=UPI001FDFD59F|nr:hypothetical protein [Mesorhizobium sp. M7A.F.Ca.ET.027.02.1.1]